MKGRNHLVKYVAQLYGDIQREGRDPKISLRISAKTDRRVK